MKPQAFEGGLVILLYGRVTYRDDLRMFRFFHHKTLVQPCGGRRGRYERSTKKRLTACPRSFAWHYWFQYLQKGQTANGKAVELRNCATSNRCFKRATFICIHFSLHVFARLMKEPNQTFVYHRSRIRERVSMCLKLLFMLGKMHLWSKRTRPIFFFSHHTSHINKNKIFREANDLMSLLSIWERVAYRLNYSC